MGDSGRVCVLCTMRVSLDLDRGAAVGENGTEKFLTLAELAEAMLGNDLPRERDGGRECRGLRVESRGLRIGGTLS